MNQKENGDPGPSSPGYHMVLSRLGAVASKVAWWSRQDGPAPRVFPLHRIPSLNLADSFAKWA